MEDKEEKRDCEERKRGNKENKDKIGHTKKIRRHEKQ